MLFDRTIGVVPLGIGVLVLLFVWGSGANLLFCLFTSVVALFFIMTGARVLSGNLHNPERLRQMAEQLQARLPDTPERHRPAASGPVDYGCDSCGAPLSSDAEVSPHGDVKCAHCNRWFNIHSSSP